MGLGASGEEEEEEEEGVNLLLVWIEHTYKYTRQLNLHPQTLTLMCACRIHSRSHAHGGGTAVSRVRSTPHSESVSFWESILTVETPPHRQHVVWPPPTSLTADMCPSVGLLLGRCNGVCAVASSTEGGVGRGGFVGWKQRLSLLEVKLRNKKFPNVEKHKVESSR